MNGDQESVAEEPYALPPMNRADRRRAEQARASAARRARREANRVAKARVLLEQRMAEFERKAVAA